MQNLNAFSINEIYPSKESLVKGMHCIMDISDGARLKCWYKDENDVVFLYKENKINTYGEYTFESLAEILAMRLCDQLGIPCVRIRYSPEAILSQVMLPATELKSFVELSDEMSHSFHLSNLTTFNITTLLNPRTNPYCNRVVQMLLFDALIGNSDRHPGNFMYSDSNGFYPLFDNGSSLCCYVLDCQIQDILLDTNRFLAMCTTKSKPVLRDQQKLTHKQLVEILRESYPKQFGNFSKSLGKLKIEELFNGISVSSKRKELISKFLEYRAKWFEV